MRGGLGRTLLTVFLILTIGPLSLVSFFAITRTRHEIERLSLENLQTTVYFLASEANRQIEHHRTLLFRYAVGQDVPPDGEYWVVDRYNRIIKQSGAGDFPPPEVTGTLRVNGIALRLKEDRLDIWMGVPLENEKLAMTVTTAEAIFSSPLPATSQPSAVFLVWGNRLWPVIPPPVSLPSDVFAAIPEYSNGAGIVGRETAWMVAGVPLWDDVALVGLQPTRTTLATSDSLAGALIAATLAVALLTTVAAAVMIRQITRPVFELTRTAVLISQGDLNRRALVNRTDELGILAFAFNTMAERLQELLGTLEQRVAERTEQLAKANALLERRARYLELSAEVGREVSRLASLDAVIERAVTLIHDRFGFESVHLWLFRRHVHDSQEPAFEERGVVGILDHSNVVADVAHRVVAEDTALWRTVDGKTVMGFPLRLGIQLIGALVVVSSEPFVEGDLQTLQVLADQLTIAVENARASEMERVALEKLKQLEERRAEFLGQMSRELSTALNSIIGFSTLLLKGVEGPLTESQRSDLTYINRNGRHLLALLDGLLELLEEQPAEEQRVAQSPEPVHEQES